ncbi:MAG: calcium-binding protein [Boseongicola sp.]|nr:calcium-binding protein [Boseongicola sp.]
MEILLAIFGVGLLASLVGGGSGDTLANEEPDLTDEGTPGPDTLPGTFLDDVIFGRAGDDLINGDVGNDFLDGNADNDQVFGDVGDDSLFGGDGDDTLGGGTGEDFLRGGAGDDVLRGGADDDVLEGALNADTLEGDGGNDTLRGGPGKDFLTGNLGFDELEGGPGDDTLIGLGANFRDAPDTDPDDADRLEGWEGADFIVMGAGDDVWGEFVTTKADGASDTFVSGIWASGNPPTVHDFDPLVDQLVLYYDPAVLTDPTVTVTPIDIGGETTFQVGLDGDVLMLVELGTTGGVVAPTDVDLRTPSLAPTV